MKEKEKEKKKKKKKKKKYDESVKELMASQRQTFSAFGPQPISSFDWNNLYHRTSSLSCLVQGVYTMERDRQKKVGLNSQAKDWWERVGFTLEKKLTDKKDDSIYGAVFKKDKSHQQNTPNSAVVAPQYVIAFRGTMVKWKTIVCDVKNNFRFALENLHCGKRFEQIIQEIQTYVDIHGNTAVWITGHSLGAGLALRAGKTMAMSGFPVEAYIFNPPSSLIPLDKILKHHENLKRGIRIARDVTKAGVTVIMAIANNKVQEDHSLVNLASWRPHLFVNRLDPICSEYLAHFQHKAEMVERGLEIIQSLADGWSVRNMLFGRGGESSSSNSSPRHLHFLPSAFMLVNNIVSPHFKTDHGIQQWWKPTLQDHSDFHRF